MIRLLGNRLLQAGFVALTVGALTFVLMRLLPGDMAYRIAAGRYGYDMVSAEAAASVRAELGLDQSGWFAFGRWIWDILTLDLGRSLVSGERVVDELAHQLGASVTLALCAVALSLVIGPPLGMLAGRKAGSVLDRLLLVAAVTVRALPPFVIGLLLILVFALSLGLLPAAGHSDAIHLVLPSVTLALGLAAVSSRVARDATAEVVAAPFYAFARLKGLPERELFPRHGLRNVSVPVVTYLGVQLVMLIEGVVVVETLFAWPGIGHALVHAIVQRDLPMVQGTALCMGLMFVVLNAVVDIVNAQLDPRARSAA
ncbi:MAG: ABC transporter permease [Aurantimonas endophytica]|uniref:Peptide/nickel transport system permease protein n=1 Tax=Aurantimonas endophytica TaxID=1522175 RepID=A0A7W6HHK3_9HYPH|nr:ABC transporter permease [Aurantimonas endophytica]MBB4005361.1 peptide/nickel transport system permease protein [Aurantimonas endophytica]MCO6405978.1 ABC transporter permease subunit [Aurantimonas endophytica]